MGRQWAELIVAALLAALNRQLRAVLDQLQAMGEQVRAARPGARGPGGPGARAVSGAAAGRVPGPPPPPTRRLRRCTA
jgi:hypothetical protein